MTFSTSVRLARPSLQALFAYALLFWMLLSAASIVRAQTSATDGTTPPGMAPGAPAGSYSLSDIDQVNLFNGNLNFHLPLLSIGGRGGAQMKITLAINSVHWRTEQNITEGSGQEGPLVGSSPPYRSLVSEGGANLVYYTPIPEKWSDTVGGLDPGYGPGVLIGRRAGEGKAGGGRLYGKTLTRLTFIACDGTEYELRDQLTGGQPHQTRSFEGPFSRGTVFVSADGSAATFISDTPITDAYNIADNPPLFPTGYLLLADGARSRVEGGLIKWTRDRNGNRLSFTYGANSSDPLTYRRVLSITDSLNRVVTISYADMSTVMYDQISYKGAGGAPRTIKIWRANLGQVLRPNSGYTIRTNRSLFPEFFDASETLYDPTEMVSAVELPDGRRYRFYYNPYGELARVELPTGGAFEYDYTSGSGVVEYSEIHRRVVERRALPDGVNLAMKHIYNATYTPPGSGPHFTTVIVEQRDAGNALLAGSKHYFYGSPVASMYILPTFYPSWKESREYQSETLAADGSTVLQRVVNTWQQRAPVSWWTGGADDAPPNGPRVVETVTTLADSNLVTKQTFAHDQYNNVIDAWEYGFGAGAPGPLIRRAHTAYLTTNGYQGSADYAADYNIHIRNLPIQKLVYDASGNLISHTDLIYDHYGAYPLVERPGIVQHEGGFHAGYGARGNLTEVIHRNPGGSPSEIHLQNQYDVAGNLVKAVDGRGYATDFDFSDRFGFADDEARSNSGAPELAGGFTYALPTKVINALDHTAYTQYDYYLGALINSEDANGVVSSVVYNDVLDRPTQGIQARYKVGVGALVERRQTTFTYDDTNRVITTRSDLNTFNDNVLTSKVYNDGFGRTWRSAAYEGNSSWTIKDTQFDALGRVSQVSNPYRAADPVSASAPSDLWTTTNYDALGRVIKVTTPDGAHVDTTYSGNQVTVTDQAGKRRRSETDALGRLVKVIEDPGGLNNYETTYLYDVLGNLRKVTQGVQTRWFAYDSLSRLIRVKNPEQNANSSLPPHTDPVTGGGGWCMAYSYDANGNLVSKTDARNITTNYAYDALNRNTTGDYSNTAINPDIMRQYDGVTNGKGRFWADYAGGINSTDPEGEHNVIGGYDALGRPLTKHHLFKENGVWSVAYSVSQTYDLAGNVKTVTYPSGRTVNYSYDQAGRLSSFSGALGGSPRTYTDMIGYNAAGQMVKERFGTNTSLYHNRHYNNRQQLASIRVGDNPTSTMDWSRGAIDFFYGATAVASGNVFANDTDNNGNLRWQTHWVPLEGGGHVIPQHVDYTYDALNRLSSFTEAQKDSSGQWISAASQNYSYDRYGNRRITGATGGVNNYNPTYDQGSNRINGLGYDATGNVTSDPMTGGLMTYDAENRLLTATNGIGGSYTYDADGRRMRRITGVQETWHVYGIGGELLAEYAANAQPTAPQKEYGYRGGQLLIIAESGSSGGVSFGKPALKSSADLTGKAGPGLDGAADGPFEVDEAVADLEFNEDTGSTTAEVSNNNNTGTHIDEIAGTTAEGYGNASSASGVGGALLAEYPPAAVPSPNLHDLDKARGTELGTPKAMPKDYGGSGGALATAQSIVVVNPSAYQTSDSGQGGAAINDPSNTGHAPSSADAPLDEITLSASASCLWFGFPAVAGGKLFVRLKIDYTSSGYRHLPAANTFKLSYSLDGGSSWTDAVSRIGFTTSQNGTFTLDLPISQDLTQVRVSDFLSAGASAMTYAGVTATVSSIRIEVEMDNTAPVISNVAAGGVTDTSATITWNTNEGSDSQVEYGTTAAYGQSTALNSTLVTAHSQGLSGLTPGTLYHYRVKSRDSGGNLAVSGDFSFTTPDTTPPVIFNVAAGGITDTSATITWNTNENSDSQVEYGPTTAYGQSTTLNSARVTAHSQGLSSLTSGTLYHYRVKSRDAAGNLTVSGAFSFTTPDMTPPVISNVAAGGITASDARITWTTNENSDSQVEYGTTTAYGQSTTLNPTLVTAHSQGLLSLTPGTLYHYRVKSRDAAGNLTVSGGFTFTTAQSGSAKIKWLVTDHLGSTRMVIDATGSLEEIKRHDFAPFGEELSAGVGIRSPALGYGADSTRQKFTSKERDSETGLDYFLARYHSSVQGRFTSVDPENAGADPELPQTWNGYSYAINNPLTYSDPDGLKVKICDTNGNCTDISDDDARQYFFNKNYQKQAGYSVDRGKVYDSNNNLIGTYQNICCDSLPAWNAGVINYTGAVLSEPRVWVGAAVGVTVGAVLASSRGGNTSRGSAIQGNGVTTTSPSRSAALRDAKLANDIPLSRGPEKIIKPNTPEGRAAGLRGDNVRLYEYTNSNGQKIWIREDKAASYGAPGGKGDQGPHFNSGPKEGDLKNHHYWSQ